MDELDTSDFLRFIASRHTGRELERLREIADVIDAWDAQDSRRAAALDKAGLGEYIYA